MSSFFRRSRTGCVDCKHLRIKCDESKPTCKRCEVRGVVCGGYPLQIRWVNDPSPTDEPARALKKQHQGQHNIIEPSGFSRSYENHTKALELRTGSIYLSDVHCMLAFPDRLQLHSTLDKNLYDHSVSTLPNLVFLNRLRSHDINNAHIWALHNADSGVRAALLLSSATHLFIKGCVPEVDFLKIRQRAFRAVRTGVEASLGRRTRRTSSISNCLSITTNEQKPPSYGLDVLITASLKLAATALINGELLENALPILQGTAFLVMERHRLARSNSSDISANEPNSPILAISVRMLAYFDIMSSVPCARAPYLPEEYWLTDKQCTSQENIDGSGLDPAMGCFPIVFALLGRSAALIDARFSGSLSPSHATSIAQTLLHDLEHWAPLPRRLQHPNASPTSPPPHDDEYAICVSAGNAYSLATRIYLLRSWDHDPDSPAIQSLVKQLHFEVLNVPMHSAPMTAMLWPLWVLGCESYTAEMRDAMVLRTLGLLFERNTFRNIQQTREMLESRIWRLEGGDHGGLDGGDEEGLRDGCRRYGQAEWVRYCWEEGIRLILA
ncbi:hypothetical protein BU24DRAFT_456643 [Aaosphaeria arxii CBS 175.79]|uniref:Zn(2)-C6 fungal-type domain-containing protein n=1 Tax=Aaosphaeria arxii CBS 175.79 TaxID=1450172 RepID=A0A6A5Y4S6_9PLEO|nr:uncharacterized protein BU24DRAFT_456643 [Aaosphaeria arxii CBS 175.79]KAF2020585.1 hypothetical protein BU24DRAFT_456643 [Aaosphaeria arxii CBS 175.79]